MLKKNVILKNRDKQLHIINNNIISLEYNTAFFPLKVNIH